MDWTEVKIRGWSDLAKEFDFLGGALLSINPYLFRGQTDATWDLVDSFSRLLHAKGLGSDATVLEYSAYREFLGRAHLYLDASSLPGEQSILAWWAIMQHFRCPTRLLDWSRSPFIGTYFAVRDRFDRDGVVWAFDSRELVACDSRPEIKEMRSTLDKSSENAGVFWKIEGNETKPPNSQFIHPFTLKRHHIRSVTQQGAFTVCGRLPASHSEMIDQILTGRGSRCRLKFIIDKDAKLELLRQLHQMNISAESLFPGPDGLGEAIKEFVLLELPDFNLF
jgi:hypothetical protein